MKVSQLSRRVSVVFAGQPSIVEPSTGGSAASPAGDATAEPGTGSREPSGGSGATGQPVTDLGQLSSLSLAKLVLERAGSLE